MNDKVRRCERKRAGEIVLLEIPLKRGSRSSSLARAQSVDKYILLTKREVKMAGYWSSSLFAFLWTETKLHFKFKFSNSKQTFVFNLPVFAAKRIFKTYQYFCFLCFHSRGHFSWFHKDREITKSLFTLAESNFSERKLSCTRLNFVEILFAGTKRAVPGGQYHSILPARVANQNTEFAAYCPLAELVI